jgi:DNA-binding MarR family transcriptional regulator
LATILIKFPSLQNFILISFLHACQGRLAMTALNAQYSGDAADRQFGYVCQTAIDGRRAARSLMQWSERFQLSESELQILWCLCSAPGKGVDQTTLAHQLALSPPQVSACVEKLRGRGLIVIHETVGDRRRRLWQPSANGRFMLRDIVHAAGESTEAAA